MASDPASPGPVPEPVTGPEPEPPAAAAPPQDPVGAGAWSLPRGVIILVGLGALVATVAGIKAFQGILAPALFSLMLVIAVAPLQQIFMRYMPGWAAVTVTLAVVYGVLLGLVVVLVVSVARLATLLPEYAVKAQGLQENLESTLARFDVGSGEVADLLANFDYTKLLGLFEAILTSTLGLLSSLTLIVTLLFFMVVDAAGFPQRARASAQLRPDLVTALRRFVWGTQQYLIVSTIFGAIVAVLDTIALYLLGIPLAILWGLLSFITNYIPNIGFIIGLIPPAVLALLEGGVGNMLLVIAVYCVLNLVIQTIIQPRFVGDAVGLSTSLTFISLIFWAWVLGPLGALLAVPMTLLAKALLIDLDPSARWAIPFIGAGPDAASDDEPPFGPDITGTAEEPAPG